MGCIEDLKPDIILSSATFKECREFIEKSTKEVYYVEPGYRLFEEYMIGVPPIAIGVDRDSVIFPYTKPCHGTFLLRLPGNGEIARLRKELAGKRKKP
jgi:hypothetical protein